MKKIISLILTFIIIFSCFTIGLINVSAASSVISFSDNDITVGDTLTVTVTISADETMYSYGFSLEYDSEVLEVILGDGQSGGAGVINAAGGANSKRLSVSCKFKAIKAGSCYIRTQDVSYGNYDYEDVSVPSQGATVTVKDASLSANANLKSLSVSEGKLSPSFSKSTTSYSVEVDREVTSCKIYATAEDKDARVAVEGGSNLKVGKNTCTVTVTAPSGAQKKYTVNITRLEENTDTDPDDEPDTDEPTEDTPVDGNPLSIEIDGTEYTVSQSIEGIDMPTGFTENKAVYNGTEVSVITDEDNNYLIYYLTASNNTESVPYVLNSETNTFERLAHIKQGGRYYIFSDFPESGFDGYYLTNSDIGGFNVKSYASNRAELSAFSYIYCFNGEKYDYYRYDSSEKVIQRYPEMKLNISFVNDSGKEEGFSKKFALLDTNAKIIVIGILLVILCVLALVILIVIRLIYHRGAAEHSTNLNYTKEFDNVDYENKFSVENGGFLALDDEPEPELDFGEDVKVETPAYIVEEDATPTIDPDDEVDSDFLTDDTSEETPKE